MAMMPVSGRRASVCSDNIDLRSGQSLRGANNEAALTKDIVAQARQYGRYTYLMNTDNGTTWVIVADSNDNLAWQELP